MELASEQVASGMMLALDGGVYRVESSLKVAVPKGSPFIKIELKNLRSGAIVEKNFAIGQIVEEVKLEEHALEYLYSEGEEHVFFDIDRLESISVPENIVEKEVNYLKEAIRVKAMFYGEVVFSIVLPQFLELKVVKLEDAQSSSALFSANKIAILETGAHIEVPLFIAVGDVIKVDTHIGEYVQRV